MEGGDVVGVAGRRSRMFDGFVCRTTYHVRLMSPSPSDISSICSMASLM